MFKQLIQEKLIVEQDIQTVKYKKKLYLHKVAWVEFKYAFHDASIVSHIEQCLF